MFSGSLVAIVTPMRPDGAVDLAAWERLIELHLANGTSGIVVAEFNIVYSETNVDGKNIGMKSQETFVSGNRVLIPSQP